MKFSARHDSYTVMMCAKFLCDRYILNQSIANFERISNLIAILLVGLGLVKQTMICINNHQYLLLYAFVIGNNCQPDL